MADDGQGALVEGLRSHGFEVELKDTGRVFRGRYVCYLARVGLS